MLQTVDNDLVNVFNVTILCQRWNDTPIEQVFPQLGAGDIGQDVTLRIQDRCRRIITGCLDPEYRFG
jgi:hypothetical protein